WGGGLAQQFPLPPPPRCRRLVLAATGPGTLMVPAHPRVLARMATPRRYLDPGYAERVAADLYGGATPGPPRRAPPLLHPTRLPLPAGRGGRLAQPAAAALDPAADPAPGRRRRPHRPAGQRPDHATAAAR